MHYIAFINDLLQIKPELNKIKQPLLIVSKNLIDLSQN